MKILRPEFAADPELMSSFRREVRSVASLDHPAIVRVFDFGTVPETVATATELAAGSPWLAMEYADGTLGEMAGSSSWSELCDLITQLLGGLAHSHARRIVHRDIKPRNVLVHRSGNGGRVRYSLTDFGIAQALTRAAHHAEAGTPGYMAPEQIVGDWRALGPGTDLYALGCLAWRMATGRPPHEGATAQAVMQAQIAGRIGRFKPMFEVPPGFEDWLRTLMEVSPERRFSCAADALSALQALSSGGEPEISIPDDWRPTYLSATVRPDGTTVRPNGTGLALFVLRPWPLVGREAVQDFLWSELHKVASNGMPRMVVLAGGPGIGKSRLARWLSERVMETGAGWAFRVGHDRSGSHGLREAIQVELRLDGLESDEALVRLTRILAARGSPSPEEEASRLLEWLDAPAHPAQRTGGQLDIGPVVTLLDRLAHDRPLVLWVDDLHWANDALVLLERLGRSPRQVLVVATLDPDLVPPVRRAAIEALVDAGLRIDLGPLPLEDHRRLVDGGVGLEPRLASKLVARTAGNPSYAVRIVTEWVRRGLLLPTSNGYGLRDPMSFVLPDALSMQLGASIEPLTSQQLAALEALAILGGRVREHEWVDVCHARGIPMDADLRGQLVEAGVVLPSEDSSETRWSFSPPLLREVVLERSKAAGRYAPLHEVCARVLLAEGRPLQRERAVMHLVEASRTAAALAALRSLIEDTLRTADPERIASLVKSEQHLLELVGAPADDPRRLPGRVDALTARVERGEEVELGELQALMDLAARAQDARSASRTALLALSMEDKRGRLRADDPLFEMALRWVPERSPEMVALHRLCARAHARGRNFSLAERELSSALDLAEQLGDPSERGMVLLTFAEILSQREALQPSPKGAPASTEAEECLAAARQAFQEARDAYGLASVELCAARICRRRQDLVGALDRARRAQSLLARNRLRTAMANRELGLVRLMRGETSQARTALTMVLPPDGVTQCALLATTPAGGDWAAWDEALSLARQALARGWSDPDSAWTLEWAAKRAADAGSRERADTVYALAELQYERIRDAAGVERVQKRRAALPQVVSEARPNERITAARRP